MRLNRERRVRTRRERERGELELVESDSREIYRVDTKGIGVGVTLSQICQTKQKGLDTFTTLYSIVSPAAIIITFAQ